MGTRTRRATALLTTLTLICALLMTPLGGVFPATRAATTISLTKGSWDIIGLDSNKPGPPKNEGPNQFLIQIHVANTGTEPATNVMATFTWTSSNAYVNLHSSEPASKTIGTIPVEALPAERGVRDAFFLIEVTRTAAAYDTSRSYTVTITGSNFPGPPTITGNLYVQHLVSQNRNSVTSVTPLTLTPVVGEIFTVDVDSDTSTNYDRITTPVIGYDPSMVQPIGVVTTYGATTSYDILQIDAGGTVFQCHWTLRAVAVGATFLGPYIYDRTGSSYHYNKDYGQDRASIIVLAQADVTVLKSVNTPSPHVGDTISYTITASNAGPSTATGVTVTDVLPAGLSLVSATPSVGTWSSPTWSIGSLANGATATLTIVATVAGTVTPGTPIPNTATITAVEADPDPGDNTSTATVTPLAVTDLVITKTAPAGPYDLGTNATFAITATNNGPSTATGISATDVLPVGLTYVSSSPLGQYDAGTGIWSIGSLANGAIATLDIVAAVNAIGSIANTVSITGIEFDPNTSNNTASATISGTAVDLTVTKTVDVEDPYVGDLVHFSVTVTNDGPGTATDVTVVDVLPAGLSYDSSHTSQGSYAGGTWSVGTLANGQEATLGLVARVNVTGPITNAATATSSSTDTNPDNNSGSAVVTGIASADLEALKTASVSSANVGDPVTFVVTVINHSPSTATGVIVADVLPAGLSFVSATPSPGTSWSAPTWSIGSLASGATATLTIQTTVATAGTLTNSAEVSSPTHDPNLANNTAQVTVYFVPSPSLLLSKSCVHAKIAAGESCAFTLSVQNNGNVPLTVVQLDDELPPGFTYGTATGPVILHDAVVAPGPTPVPQLGDIEISWGNWTINPGGYVQLTFSAATAASIAPGVYRNHVTAYSVELPPITTNAEVVVGASADLAITKVANTTTPLVASNVTFTLTVTNHGPDTATNITVNDTLPTGLTYVSSNASQGSYDSGTHVWTIGTLADSAYATLGITATVTQAGAITNTASVHGDETDPDADNNTDSETVTGTAPQLGSLTVTKIVNWNGVPIDSAQSFLMRITGPSYPLGNEPGGVKVFNATNGWVQTWTNLLPGNYFVTEAAPGAMWTVGLVGSPALVTGGNQTAATVINTHDAPGTPDVHLRKSVSRSGAAVPGTRLTYTLTYSNTGTATSSPLTITDVLDDWLDEATLSIGQGGSYNGTTRTITWNVGVVPAGGSSTVTFAVNVRSTLNTSLLLRNTGFYNAILGGTGYSNTVETPVVPPVVPPEEEPEKPLPPLAITIDVTTQDCLCVGAYLPYKICFTNGVQPYTYTVDFGDGTPIITGTTSSCVTLDHAYLEVGQYSFYVTVHDTQGLESTRRETFTAKDCTEEVVVYHHNFFIGYPDKAFRPEGSITRPEIAAAMSRALGVGWSIDQPGFSDVKPEHWATGYITLMRHEGFVVGDTGGTFRPDAPITRAEAAAVLLRIAGITPVLNPTSSSFSDVQPTHWAAGYIEAGRTAGLLAGYPDNTFKPANFLSRAEFATLASHTLGREPTNTNPREYPEYIVLFPDVSRDFWAYNNIVEVSTPHTVTSPTRLTRVITLKQHDIPLYTEGENGTITFLRVGDAITAIVPVDGIQPDGSDPAPRQVKVRIIERERP